MKVGSLELNTEAFEGRSYDAQKLAETSSAFAIGPGIGAVVDMMWAPKSGEETRTLLRKKAQDGIDEAVAGGKRVVRKAQKATENAKEFVNDAVDAGQSAYREARNSQR